MRWTAGIAVLLAALSAGGIGLAWNAQQRVRALEAELVRRQRDASSEATEARMLARQAQDAARETAAKLALLDARVAESTLQRSQLEDLIQSLARSRDENVLADVEASIRFAQQQSAITGSSQPLVLALKQADERLARDNQPQLERVRLALAQDLERARAAGGADLSVLALRLDEAIRIVDELPLLAQARPPGERAPAVAPAPSATRSASAAASGAPDAAAPDAGARLRAWAGALVERWHDAAGVVWREARSLVRVTRIEAPEAALLAPEQAYFLRENLKLRLLNARLALLSRQFETVQSDLGEASAMLERYFDRGSRRVASTVELLRQIAAQAHQVVLPRPDATLAAIATASAGR